MIKNESIQLNRQTNGVKFEMIKHKDKPRKHKFRAVLTLSDNFIKTTESMLQYIDYGFAKSRIHCIVNDIKRIG